MIYILIWAKDRRTGRVCVGKDELILKVFGGIAKFDLWDIWKFGEVPFTLVRA